MLLESAGGGDKSKATKEGKTMIIFTSIYCAKLQRTEDALTHKPVEPSIADLKGAYRDLLTVYQGTNRTQPMDGDR
jgi:hypothetical protein